MPEPALSTRTPLRRGLAKLGMGASALAVFTCGWLSMRATDWPRILLFALLALVAGMIASAFARAGR